jgi:hypothetical protein
MFTNAFVREIAESRQVALLELVDHASAADVRRYGAGVGWLGRRVGELAYALTDGPACAVGALLFLAQVCGERLPIPGRRGQERGGERGGQPFLVGVA